MVELEVAVDGGKDSLSMAANAGAARCQCIAASETGQGAASTAGPVHLPPALRRSPAPFPFSLPAPPALTEPFTLPLPQPMRQATRR